MSKDRNAICRRVSETGEDIITSNRFAKARTVPHHGRYLNTADHSIEVAEWALRISEWLDRHGMEVDGEETVKAALLHDIGMTEDAVFLSPSRVKARTHPKEGARIAREEFSADDVQIDAILRHMWPIGFVPPRHVTGWVVVAADKCASMNDVRRGAVRMGRRLRWKLKGRGRNRRYKNRSSRR